MNLIDQRIQEAEAAIRAILLVTWDVGTYPHFKKKRGFGVTFLDSDSTCHMLFARKLFQQPLHRQDGVVRHEIGHAVDFLIPGKELDRWARLGGVHLPHTAEKRADSIAQAIWGAPLLYDKELVQSTEVGSFPRPANLGA